MSAGRKILLGGAATAAVGIGGYCLYVKHVCDKLAITQTVAIQSLDLKNIRLQVSVTIKNPAMFGFSFTDPFITVKYREDTIYTSVPSNKIITIPGSGQVTLDDIIINIPLGEAVKIAAGAVGLGSISSLIKSIGSAISKLTSSVKNKEAVELSISIDTRLVIIQKWVEIKVPTIVKKIAINP